MLQSKYGLLTDQGQKDMENTRVEIAKAGVATAGSLRSSIDQWRALAKAAPWFMAAALVISVAVLTGAFLLVKWGLTNALMLPPLRPHCHAGFLQDFEDSRPTYSERFRHLSAGLSKLVCRYDLSP